MSFSEETELARFFIFRFGPLIGKQPREALVKLGALIFIQILTLDFLRQLAD